MPLTARCGPADESVGIKMVIITGLAKLSFQLKWPLISGHLSQSAPFLSYLDGSSCPCPPSPCSHPHTPIPISLQLLRRLLGYWLLAVAPLVPLKSLLLSPEGRKTSQGECARGAAEQEPPSPAASGPSSLTAPPPPIFRPLRLSDAALAATGIVAGFASGLLGIGGGTIVTPALALFTNMDQAQVD